MATSKKKTAEMKVRFPVEIRDRLTDEAKARDVSANQLVTTAVEAYLAVLEPVERVVPRLALNPRAGVETKPAGKTRARPTVKPSG